eukprot:1187586-Prorocentrum_minimum.AAC.1
MTEEDQSSPAKPGQTQAQADPSTGGPKSPSVWVVDDSIEQLVNNEPNFPPKSSSSKVKNIARPLRQAKESRIREDKSQPPESWIVNDDNFSYTLDHLIHRKPIFPPKTHLRKRGKVDGSPQLPESLSEPGVRPKIPRPYWENPEVAGRVKEQSNPPKKMTYPALRLGLRQCTARELATVKNGIDPMDIGRKPISRHQSVQSPLPERISQQDSRPGTATFAGSEWSVRTGQSSTASERYQRIHREMTRVYGTPEPWKNPQFRALVPPASTQVGLHIMAIKP